MKKIVSIFFVIFFAVQGLMFFRPPEDVLPYENRNARKFPSSLRLTAHGIKDFFSAADGAFNDRMLARKLMVTAYGYLGRLTGDIGSLDFAFRGQDDWLFLGNTHNNCIEKLLGTPSSSTRRTSEMHIQSIMEGAEHLMGLEIMVMPAPNKSAVYPDKLPRFMKPTAERYADEYIARLRAVGLTIADPREALKAAGREQLLYYRSDTHWNLAGAAVAFEHLLAQINALNKYGRLATPAFSLLTQPPFNGDLVKIGNFIQYQARPGDNFQLAWTDETPKLTVTDKDSQMISQGGDAFFMRGDKMVTVVNPAAASNLTVWFYHDSFGVALAPFFHAVFAKTVHMERSCFGTMLPPGEPPDLVVLEIVERIF
ncbi:MAG: hypothetical protein LBV79_09390 [Candidatus Adiutrix sp.]|jgi:hypothetical protein|nr:hypothetical protein [Candidatus Adiutrix sp.]